MVDTTAVVAIEHPAPVVARRQQHPHWLAGARPPDAQPTIHGDDEIELFDERGVSRILDLFSKVA